MLAPWVTVVASLDCLCRTIQDIPGVAFIHSCAWNKIVLLELVSLVQRGLWQSRRLVEGVSQGSPTEAEGLAMLLQSPHASGVGVRFRRRTNTVLSPVRSVYPLRPEQCVLIIFTDRE